MTFAEYARIRHPVPYLLEFSVARGALLYFGAEHIVGQTAHPQIQQIQDLWQRFRPTLALNEGWDPPVASRAEEAVKLYGEPGLLRFLASRDGVPCRNFEPLQGDEARFLRARYTPEEIKLFYLLRSVAQNWRSLTAETVDRQAQRQLSNLSLVPGLEGAPNSIPEVGVAFSKLALGQPSDWRRISVDDLDPATARPSRLQSLNAELARFRDAHIVDVLVAQVQRGERVFAVVGASHVVIQEALLRARLRN
jgi:hypothetical protein